jgi:hypothetical protein
MVKASDEGFRLRKDAAEAEEEAERARSMWANRDRRMAQDEDAYLLRHASPKPGETRQLLNDCAVQVDAADDLMATVDMAISVSTDEQAIKIQAQDVEDLLRSIWYRFNLDWAQVAQMPLMWSLVHSLNLYGWLCPRTMLYPKNKAFPYSFELLDPRRVYPDRPMGKPDIIYYFTEETPRRLCALFGRTKVRDILGPESLDSPDPIAVIHYHTDYETAISCGGQWLKKPTLHKYSRNPVQIYMASGQTFRGTPPGGEDLTVAYDREDWDAQVGTSFIQTIRPVVEDAQKLATLRADLLARTVAPTRVAKLRRTKLGKFPSRAGDTLRLEPDESYEEHAPPPQALQFAIQMAQERNFQVQQAGINAALLGSGEVSAGYDRFLLSSAGARRLRPRLEAFRLALISLFEHVLHLYSRYGGPPLRFKSTSPDTGAQSVVKRLKPGDVQVADMLIDVQFGEIGVPDLAQRMTTAAMGVREGLISQEYALTEILRVQNPTKVQSQTRKDQVWKVPQVVEMMALWETAQDDTLGPLQMAAREALPASMARLLELAKPPQPPGPGPRAAPPGGMPPGMPPGFQGPPLPGGGLPSVPTDVLPPALAGAPPGPNMPMLPGGMPPGAALPGF